MAEPDVLRQPQRVELARLQEARAVTFELHERTNARLAARQLVTGEFRHCARVRAGWYAQPIAPAVGFDAEREIDLQHAPERPCHLVRSHVTAVRIQVGNRIDVGGRLGVEQCDLSVPAILPEQVVLHDEPGTEGPALIDRVQRQPVGEVAEEALALTRVPIQDDVVADDAGQPGTEDSLVRQRAADGVRVALQSEVAADSRVSAE
jgi:hypothetical protein